jgi:uncharacterized membrane protein YfcA
METAFVVLASLAAGLVDSIVGGGGLILVPALFAAYPSAAPATLFGTNKSASVWGTSFAAGQYARRVDLRWRNLWPAAATALAGSFLGAWTVTMVDPAFLRRLLPFLLVAMFVYTLTRRDLGRAHAPLHGARHESAIAAAIGAVIGWYDGFFGPGTGSLFVFLFVRLLGYDFLHASAAAKLLNVATNVAAIALFAAKGHVWWQLGLAMAVANVAGSLVGTRLALKHGAGFVRAVFIAVVGALIIKTGYDALRM